MWSYRVCLRVCLQVGCEGGGHDYSAERVEVVAEFAERCVRRWLEEAGLDCRVSVHSVERVKEAGQVD